MEKILKKVLMLLAILCMTSQLYGQWVSGIATSDPMTGEKVAYASSPWVRPNVEIPYGDIQAALVIYRKDEREWVSIVFSEDMDIENNFTYTWNIRTKWDDEITTTLARIKHYTTAAINMVGPDVISRIRRHDSIMVELEFIGLGVRYLVFPLEGSSNAIEEMRTKLE